MTLAVLASVRGDVAGFLSALIYVYELIILAYIVSQWLFSFGLRPGYSRSSAAVLGFLHDVCEPYLRVFRRFIPMLGPLDLSPIAALIVLQIVNSVVVNGIIA